MPGKGSTPRNIRIDKTLWLPAKDRADRENPRGGVSEVVRSLLTSWLNGTIDAPERGAQAHVSAVARIRAAIARADLTEVERLEAVRVELAELDDDLAAVAADIAADADRARAVRDEAREAGA